MAQIWLISDWHWQHENIYTFTYTDDAGVKRRVREPFLNAQEGDEYIIQEWRKLVKPQDHVWGLGDWTIHRGKHHASEFVALMRSLPGHKRTILGNHDWYDMKTYVEAGFQKIRASNVFDGILLTHYPVHPSSLSGRIHNNVHGHRHQNTDLLPVISETRILTWLNVSVERTNYAPIPWEEVKRRLHEQEKAVPVST